MRFALRAAACACALGAHLAGAAAQPAQVAGAAAQPGQIIDGIAPVGPANTRADPADGPGGMDVVTLRPDPAQARQPLFRKNVRTPASEWMRARAARGWVAGMAGFVYDNRDRSHSSLKPHKFPQLAFTHYAPVYRQRGLDYGLAGAFRFSMPAIGNSSTALTKGPFARSQARLALAGQAAADRAFRLYETNHLYFYPEHRDHDPGTGDRFYANVPMLMVSQGSSGSEKELVEAAAMALGALRPDTFAAAREAGLLAPLVQMLLRTHRTGAGDYLSGPAHPSAFPADSTRMLDLVQAANAIVPHAIPPIVRLSVVRDLAARPGVDYPDPVAREQVFTTPAAIARAWRSLAYRREIVLSAADTEDPNGRELVFDWVVLRGDPDRITITHEPDDPARATARIVIDWHDAYAVPGRDDLMTARVDIGVFARNGAAVSAPSFLSVAFPVHQARRYAPGPDGRMRIAEVSYRLPERGAGFGGGYVDPALWAVADWTDTYAYPDGTSAATVTRRYGDGAVRMLRQGLGGLFADAPDGTAPRRVSYRRDTDAQGRPRLRDDRPPGTD